MSIFSRIFGKKETAANAPEHAVIVHVPLSDGANGTREEFDRLMAFEQELEAAVARAGAGEFDGNEFGQGSFTYYMYGPDADRLFASVESVLRADTAAKKGRAIIRYGPPGAMQREMQLSP